MTTALAYNAARQTLQLQFPYDPTGKRQADAKLIQGYKWRKTDKAWEYPATVEHARHIVLVFEPIAGKGFKLWWERVKKERAAADRANALMDGTAVASGDFGFSLKHSNYKHQDEYMQWAATRNLAGLTYRGLHSQQGTGKTKSEIDMTLWEIGRGMCKGMPLTFCPNSVKRNWAEEIFTFAPDNFFAPIIVEGTAAEKIDLIHSYRRIADSGVVPWFIVNYEVLQMANQSEVIDALVEMAKDGLIGKVMFDEAHGLKNTRSERSKAAYRLAKEVPIRVTMTGTPYPKQMTDIFGIMRMLSVEILGTSWPAFKRYHSLFGGFQNRQVVGYLHEEELEEKISRHVFRRMLDECVDLPEEINLYRYCDMTPAQVKVTNRLRTQMLAALEDPDGVEWLLTADNALTRLLRFNQVTSGFLEADDTLGDKQTAIFTPNPKLDLLKSIIADEMPEDEKGVIWCAYTADVDRIHDELAAQGIKCSKFYGKNSDTRHEEELAFKNDPEVRFMVATASAGGVGLNWQVASWCFFYSYNFQWVMWEQARTRIRRLTQKKRMSYVWLVAQNPQTRIASHGVSTGVNQYIIDNLSETSSMADFMNGDTAKQGRDPQLFLRQALEVM